jgi:hypothetical protein
MVNVAAIVAATKVNKQEPAVTHEYSPRYIDYELVIYKYYKFPGAKLLVGEFPNAKVATIDSKTLGKSYIFSFTLDTEKYTLAKYIEDNLDRYLRSEVCQFVDQEAAQLYIEEINKEYDFYIKPGQYSCTTSTHWVVRRRKEDGIEEVLSSCFKN